MWNLAAYWRGLPLKPQGIVVVLAGFLPMLAIVAMGPAVPTLIAHFANDPDARAQVPALIGAPGLTMAVLAPFSGLLVDKFGRRQLLLVATAFYAVFGTVPLLLESLDQIYVSRLLLGISEAVILTVVNTLIADYWDDKGRKNWLFLQSLIGPVFGGLVGLSVGEASKLQWNAVFFVYLAAIPIWAAMMVWLFEPKKAEVDEQSAEQAVAKTAFPWRSAALTALVTFFAAMLYYVFIINGALAFAEVGVTEPDRYAQLIVVPTLFFLVGAVLFRILANRSYALQLAVFFALLGAGLAAIGLAETPSAMAAGVIVQQTAAGMAVPTLLAWTHSKFDFAHRGRAMGIWTAAFFLAQSQSPRLVHVLDQSTGSMQGAFLTAGIVGIVAGAVGVVIALALRKPPQALASE
ncbi:MFS transporter [Sphingomonas sp. R647]|uniref:MFS transporter n=1 Tax=Sphingomonas sp. R647 TaxID=2875233 RepID=UPI001CD81775|nr:MFS transporter [Sphingomonas sp. R647]MCA1197763.1 MFS transporter [Sphingomonas sp. R647]